ncbi:MAG: FUSC family protein [Ferrimicrobium sp.]|nr:FUSC family protein [Ferrimicrobium sp.]
MVEAERKTFANVLASLVRTSLAIDTTALSLSNGLFSTVGVIVPLVYGFGTHHLLLGSVAAIGALLVGFAGFQRGYRSRLVTMSSAATVVTVGLVVGNSIGTRLAPSLVCYLVLGLAAGGVIAFGESASTIGIQALVAFAIGSGLGAPPSQSWSLVVATILGGIIQATITAIAIVTSTSPLECRALEGVYASLARYASAPEHDRAPNPRLISNLQEALLDPQPFRGARATAYLRLTLSAEALRTQLSMLRISQLQGGALLDGSQLMGFVVGVCQQVIEFSHRPVGAAECRALKAEITAARVSLATGSSTNETSAMVRNDLLASLETILDVLITFDGRSVSHRPITSRVAFNPFERAFSSTTRATTIRHALRLGAALVVCELLVHLLGVGHGYWGPMTVALVLRPQHISTLQRGFVRIGGTIIGVGLMTAIIVVFSPDSAVLVVLVAIVTWVGFATFRANYFVYSVSITGVVVLLFVLLGEVATTIAIDRLIDTVLGGAIAILASLVVPTRVGEPLPRLMAETMVAQAALIELLSTHWGEREEHGYTPLAQARRKRVAAIETLDASTSEAALRQSPGDMALERAILAQLDRSALALLALVSLSALHAQLDQRRQHELRALSQKMRTAAQLLASRVQTPSPVPAGRESGFLDLHPDEMVDGQMVEILFALLEDTVRSIEVLLTP